MKPTPKVLQKFVESLGEGFELRANTIFKNKRVWYSITGPRSSDNGRKTYFEMEPADRPDGTKWLVYGEHIRYYGYGIGYCKNINEGIKYIKKVCDL